ncbi:alpha-D-ribose 1-methylphosphonate 5-triphosphate diphosphatase [Ectothiorhodospira mobilis]|uniref:alpha-D-ribose 1-methylphosphonate 5-triphosphate diphosphatase n=1 Tax=Ectothiorhodospira mobilis TaxID=195064 RepID=UPI001EE92547|nr:alpha-D-ribose 1-methylphosphonate 5-triphosphate diphosphatase [Ectothiorhodospira mobilis]MCG5536795.1 alpha-D-ribose 1-methylphosphonate 5-triphosphate diphosphatase [Ectothiorhodospira mobilis]
MKTCLTHARIVTPTQTLDDASLLIEDGRIAAINPVSFPTGATEIDLEGRLLLPGLIDLHCDALEKEIEPRPGVHFPIDFAVQNADRRNAIAGITTVFHALSFANAELGVRNNAFAADIARAVHELRDDLLVDNRVHCRYEVTDTDAPALLTELLEHDAIHLLSFMDHTPGQGQFKSDQAYRDYLARSYKKSEAEIDALLEEKHAAGAGAEQRMRELAETAHKHGIQVASHDDDTPEKARFVHDLGATLSEFPINLETARTARELGMATIFGAPNILRGKSQSGSMRALDAVLEGVADCLCADYAPAAMLPALFQLVEQTGISLAHSIRLASLHPARAAGLNDRGAIAPDLRADLIAVRLHEGLPRVEGVWVAGEPRLLSGGLATA